MKSMELTGQIGRKVFTAPLSDPMVHPKFQSCFYLDDDDYDDDDYDEIKIDIDNFWRHS